MYRKSLSNTNILIADDVRVQIVILRHILVEFGFLDRNIFAAASAKEAVKVSQREKIDIFICDYNFGHGMNGKQLFEELKFMRLIHPETVFIMVTGENNSNIVRAIIELRPDEYMLKPITPINLKARMFSAMKSKKVLLKIYQAESEHDFVKGIEACDELSPFHPEYYFIIQEFKARFLSKLKLYDDAKNIYQKVSNDHNFDWSQIGLANTLIKLDHSAEADDILEKLLTELPNNTLVRESVATRDIMNCKVPRAIEHLEIANHLAEGNSERELVIVNLCLSEGLTQDALTHYTKYLDINKVTFRNNIFSQLNLIRIMLYHLSTEKENTELLDNIIAEYQHLLASKDANKVKPELELIAAHIAIKEHKYRDAGKILSKIYQEKALRHFFARYHLAWILHEMNFEKEFSNVISWCFEDLDVDYNEMIFSSKLCMGEQLKAKDEKRLFWVQQKYTQLKSATNNLQDNIDLLIELHNEIPTSHTVSLKIIKLLTKTWPHGMSNNDVLTLINHCNDVIHQFIEPNELEHLNYNAALSKARTQKISRA